jgi:hypothetical protein
MMIIGLEDIPVQELSFVADNQQYDITIRSNDDVMFMDVSINGVVVITSAACLVGQVVMPYAYLEGNGGNFIFTTASAENPQYENFGGPDILLYATNAELATARAANAAALTTITLASNQAA